jgi:hypothetical protein
MALHPYFAHFGATIRELIRCTGTGARIRERMHLLMREVMRRMREVQHLIGYN